MELYQNTMPRSYQNFLEAIKGKRNAINLNNPTASLGKGMDFLETLAHEIPVDLGNFFESQLTQDEKDYLWSKAGAIWFAKHFPQYRMTGFNKKRNVRA